MLVVLLKKTDYNTKITDTENNVNNHNHIDYIKNQQFHLYRLYYKSTVSFFNARLA